MLSSVSTLLSRLMIYRSVVYPNGIGVINIQLAEKYKNAEKGEKERMFWGSRSRSSREEGHLEPGLERGRTFGAGARERKDIWSRGSKEEGHLEPGLERSRSRGPREEGCSKEHEHEEEEGLKRA